MPEPHHDALYDPAALSSLQGTSEHVGGPRQYRGSEASARYPWKCPACGGENLTRALAEGCEHCHAGEGASRHVGVDPPPKKREVPVPVVPTVRTSTDRTGTVSRELQRAFLAWMQQAGTDVGPLAAFSAGWEAGMTAPVMEEREVRDAVVLVDHGEPDSTYAIGEAASSSEAEEPQWNPSGARPRTLLAALTFFHEQIVTQQPEECSTGEWLNAEGLTQWIAELKGPYE